MKKTAFVIALCLSHFLAVPTFALTPSNDSYGCLATMNNRVSTYGDDLTLNLTACDLQSEDMKIVSDYLKAHTDITGLILDDNNSITANGLNELVNNKSLKAISLNNIYGMGKSGAAVVAKITSLENVSIENSDIDADGVKSLASLPNLIGLDIDDNFIETEGAKSLAQNPKLQFLVLDNNLIGPEGAIALAQASSLEVLFISGNYIGDEGAIGLANSKPLSIIVAESNHIGDKGASAIAKRTIEGGDYFLGHNDITDEGAIALANNSAKYGIGILDISFNLLESAGLKALYDAMENGRIGLLGASGYKKDNFKSTLFQKNVLKSVKPKFCKKMSSLFCNKILKKLNS